MAIDSVRSLRAELSELSDPEFREVVIDETAEATMLAVADRADLVATLLRSQENHRRGLLAMVDRAYQAAGDRLTQTIGAGDLRSVASRKELVGGPRRPGRVDYTGCRDSCPGLGTRVGGRRQRAAHGRLRRSSTPWCGRGGGRDRGARCLAREPGSSRCEASEARATPPEANRRLMASRARSVRCPEGMEKERRPSHRRSSRRSGHGDGRRAHPRRRTLRATLGPGDR